MITEIDNSFKRKLEKSAERYVPKYFDEITVLVDELVYNLCIDIVNNLNLFQQKGDRETFESIIEKTSMVKDAEYFFSNVLKVLCDDGFLIKDDNHFESKKSIQDIERRTAPEMFIDGIIQFPEEIYSVKLLARVYGFIISFIRGKVFPEEILFPWGSFELVEQFYKNSNMYNYGSQILAYCLNEVIKYKFKRPVKILEVGSGTGEATESVLNVCEDYIDKLYFTDILKTFVKIGKDKFKSRGDLIEYKKFDITKEPEKQKLNQKDFDIIFAVNTIHATDDVIKSLQNIYNLLNDNGVVLITEMTAEKGQLHRFLEFTWGILPSYHKYKDTELRQGSPVLTTEKWADVLKKVNFRDVFTAPKIDTKYSNYGAVTIGFK